MCEKNIESTNKLVNIVINIPNPKHLKKTYKLQTTILLKFLCYVFLNCKQKYLKNKIP